MSARKPSLWDRWLRRPQQIWLRRALFQVHLWSGVILGIYILMMSVTGGVLVYANELYRAFTAEPVFSKGTGPILTDVQIGDAARRLYPGYKVEELRRFKEPNRALDVTLKRGSDVQMRLFDPRTGEDVGNVVPFGVWFVARMVDLHDNLLGGGTGRKVNGLGAIALLLLAGSGIVLWWPGIKTWTRGLVIPRLGTGTGRVGWRRWIWQVHGALGFWTLAFVVLFGVSGIYLSLPDPVQDLVDWLQAPTPQNAGRRIGDQVVYWLAFLHIGRSNGIGLWCKGPGVCDQTIKAIWATFGFAPAALFVTGAIMWWNRVLRPRRRAGS